MIAADAPLRLMSPTRACDLERHDAVLIEEAGESLLVEAATPALAYVASFETA